MSPAPGTMTPAPTPGPETYAIVCPSWLMVPLAASFASPIRAKTPQPTPCVSDDASRSVQMISQTPFKRNIERPIRSPAIQCAFEKKGCSCVVRASMFFADGETKVGCDGVAPRERSSKRAIDPSEGLSLAEKPTKSPSGDELWHATHAVEASAG